MDAAPGRVVTPGRRRRRRTSITADLVVTVLVLACAIAAVFLGAGYLVGRLLL